MTTPQPPKCKLQIACILADRELATSLLAAHPDLVDEFDDENQMLLAKTCWETNNDTEARRYPDVDYGGVVDALIGAGLDGCLAHYPVGHADIDPVLRRHRNAR